MQCPLCSHNLTPQSVPTNTGGNRTIDHCMQCGGTWFDPFDAIGLPFHEIVRLADESVQPKTPTFSTEHPQCPRCTIALESFQGEAVPAGVSFFQCNKCRGIWATQRQSQSYPFIPKSELPAPATPWSVSFIPTIAIVMLIFTTFLTVHNAQQSQNAQTNASQKVRQLSIESVSPSSLTVSFRTATPMKSSITITTDGFALTQDISNDLKTIHGTVVTGLPRASSFRYDIELTDENGVRTRHTGTLAY